MTYLRDYCIVLYNSLCFYTSHKASGSIGRVYNVPSICGGVIPLSNVPKCPESQKTRISGHFGTFLVPERSRRNSERIGSIRFVNHASGKPLARGGKNLTITFFLISILLAIHNFETFRDIPGRFGSVGHSRHFGTLQLLHNR